MKRRTFILSSCASLLALRRTEAQTVNLSDEAIRDILRRRIDVEKRATGMAVGIVERGRRRVIVYGKQDSGDARSVAANTLFEIGSVTKVFTALLLADMVHRKELQFDHPVDRYLPSGFRTPQRNGRAITLADLATHTSGLPFFPFSPITTPKPLEALARFTASDMRLWLAGLTLSRDPGAQWEYFKVGYGLLGLALANKAGTTYDALLNRRIIGPMRLKDTTLHPTGEATRRLAAGHDPKLAPIPPLDLGSIFAVLFNPQNLEPLGALFCRRTALTRRALRPPRRPTGFPHRKRVRIVVLSCNSSSDQIERPYPHRFVQFARLLLTLLALAVISSCVGAAGSASGRRASTASPNRTETSREETSVWADTKVEQAVEALRDAYDAFNRGDYDAAVKSLDDDIEWTEPAEFPGGGTYHGRAAVKQYLKQSRDAWAEVRSEPERFIRAGDKIVVFVRARVRAKDSSQSQEVLLADVFAFREGKAVRMRAFADRQEALRWVGIDALDSK